MAITTVHCSHVCVISCFDTNQLTSIGILYSICNNERKMFERFHLAALLPVVKHHTRYVRSTDFVRCVDFWCIRLRPKHFYYILWCHFAYCSERFLTRQVSSRIQGERIVRFTHTHTNTLIEHHSQNCLDLLFVLLLPLLLADEQRLFAFLHTHKISKAMWFNRVYEQASATCVHYTLQKYVVVCSSELKEFRTRLACTTSTTIQNFLSSI